jgi:hypothetical protein
MNSPRGFSGDGATGEKRATAALLLPVLVAVAGYFKDRNRSGPSQIVAENSPRRQFGVV